MRTFSCSEKIVVVNSLNTMKLKTEMIEKNFIDNKTDILDHIFIFLELIIIFINFICQCLAN